MKRRFAGESILFAALMVGLWLGWNAAQGMFLTRAYVPDIVNAYAGVEELQTKTAFGAAVNPLGWAELLIAFAALAVFYYGVRDLHDRWKRKWKPKR